MEENCNLLLFSWQQSPENQDYLPNLKHQLFENHFVNIIQYFNH